jgi:hypothetical protein
MMWSTHLRRIDPISCSARPFGQREAAAVGSLQSLDYHVSSPGWESNKRFQRVRCDRLGQNLKLRIYARLARTVSQILAA